VAKLGLIVRMDDTGLGNQTRALCYMLKPDVVFVINSSSFHKDQAQHPEWYDDFNTIFTEGWPTDQESARFVAGITHLLTCETVYNPHVFWLCRRYRVKLFIQPNWEFLDHLRRGLPLPDKWLMPSYWHLEDMSRRFQNVVYLPPPIDLSKFEEAKVENLKQRKKRRFLHVVGKPAVHDRNGTMDVLNALQYSTVDYTLTIRSQVYLETFGDVAKDGRIEAIYKNVESEAEMYKGYDAVIMPRRYAGLCLPMNEALASSLPVIMPDISPNDKVLPSNWRIPASIQDKFEARVPIDVYGCDLEALAAKIDEFATMSNEDLTKQKAIAYEIAQREYSTESLLDRYKYILGI
jgi:glycosyltransferase involved in cell wall biosynthesis